MRFVVAHFRSCSGLLNLAPRAYHSGDYAEIDWILARLRSQHVGPLWAVGVSLRGQCADALGRRKGAAAQFVVNATASVCAPLDLTAGGTPSARLGTAGSTPPCFTHHEAQGPGKAGPAPRFV